MMSPRWMMACLIVLLAPWAAAQPVLQNAGFEAWSGNLPTNWALTGASVSTARSSIARSGQYSVQVTANAAYSGIRQSSLSATGTAGKRLRLSCWLRDAAPQTEPPSGREYLRLMVIQNTPSGPIFKMIDSSLIGPDLPDEWRRLELNIGEIATGVTSFEIQLGLYQNEGFSFLVDDMQLQVLDALPAPTDIPTTNSMIYYGSLYVSEEGLFSPSFGATNSTRFCQDVDGDGRDDAIALDYASGAWVVSYSVGTSFVGNATWRSGFNGGTPLMGDVNGDGKADAVLANDSSGTWRVAPSSGTQFAAPVSSSLGLRGGTERLMLGDVNHDGRDDAVCYEPSTGAWRVGLSQGTTFAPLAVWITGHGVGSKNQFVGDVTGDGRADAVAFFDTPSFAGKWYVAPSSGTSFTGYSEWASGAGAGSTQQFLYDIGGDGRADAVWHQTGDWTVAASTGSAFGAAAQWLDGFLDHPAYLESIDRLIGRPDGQLAHAFCITRTIWYGLNNPRAAAKVLTTANSWAAWGMAHFPTTGGRYDSLDATVLQRQLRQLHDAGFNVLMIDHTNSTGVGFVTARVDALVAAIENWNLNLKPGEHKFYFYVAIGGWRSDPHDPVIFENEAQFVLDRYARMFASYYYQDGKPFLVNFAWTPERVESWEASSVDKTYSNRFTVRWMYNATLNEPRFANCYGWPFPDEGGNPVGDEVMGVMPGFNNFVGGPVVDRNTGQFYRSQWVRVLQYAPPAVFVNSYNEFTERTAVEPAWSPDPAWQWKDYHGDRCDNFYWEMTRRYNRLYRDKVLIVGTYFQEVGASEVYQVALDGSYNYVGVMPRQAPVLLLPAGFRSSFQGTIEVDAPQSAAADWSLYH